MSTATHSAGSGQAQSKAKQGTGIEWTHIPGFKGETWNPVTGCTKVSAGCKHCYAEREFPRLVGNPKLKAYPAGRKFTDVMCHPERLGIPLRWRKPRAVFVNSMSDLFHEDVPDEFIDQVFAVMLVCQLLENRTSHTFQILTKRPERMREYLSAGPVELLKRWGDEGNGFATMENEDTLFSEHVEGHCGAHWGPDGSVPAGTWKQWSAPDNLFPLPNVWLGVSVEDQEKADERIPLLLQTPAAVRFVSYEPALGPVSFRWAKWHDWNNRPPSGILDHLDGLRKLDWVICGGESGPNARPMHPDWARNARDQCAAVGVPFFFKQHGEWMSGRFLKPNGLCHPGRDLDGKRWSDVGQCDTTPWPFHEFGDGAYAMRVGKKEAGRLLDGREHSEFPATAGRPLAGDKPLRHRPEVTA